MIPSERERTRVNKREIMTRPPRPTLARIRSCVACTHDSHVYHGVVRTLERVRRFGTRDSARERRRSESATRGESARKREKAACMGRRGNERPSGPEARGVLAWMTRHCRGARVPRNHTACTRVYTRTHAYAARREPALARRYPLSVCPCPLGDLEMCVMKNARIIAGHSSVRDEWCAPTAESRLRDAVSGLLSAASAECIEFLSRYELFRAILLTIYMLRMKFYAWMKAIVATDQQLILQRPFRDTRIFLLYFFLFEEVCLLHSHNDPFKFRDNLNIFFRCI